MQFKPNDLIFNDKYRVQHELGYGSSGVVYLVTHQLLNRPEALKILQKNFDRGDSILYQDYRQRFMLEAQLGAKIKHPNVIEVYDHDEVNDSVYVTMEYAVEKSLKDILEMSENKQLKINDVIHVLQDAAAGLQAIHDHDVIHRDVKPSNILISNNKQIKIADFGLAQVAGGQLSMRSTLGSSAKPHPGTPAYMSPEHADPSALLPTSDIYSLGCVAFELLTGKLWLTAQRDVTQASELRSDIPEWLDLLVMRMLNETPGIKKTDREDVNKRFVDCKDLLEAIKLGILHKENNERIKTEEGIQQPTDEVTYTTVGQATDPLATEALPLKKPDENQQQKTETKQSRERLIGVSIASVALVGIITTSSLWRTTNIPTTPIPRATVEQSPTQPLPQPSPTQRIPTATITPSPTTTPRPTPTPTNTPLPTPPNALKNLAYSATTGSIPFKGKESVSSSPIPVTAKDFDLELTFKNPTKSTFDYGVIFWFQPDIGENRFVIKNDGNAHFIYYDKQKNLFSRGPVVKIKDFNATAGNKNKIALYVRNNSLTAFINNQFLYEWNLVDVVSKEGSIQIGTEYFKDTANDASGMLEFSDLSVKLSENKTQRADPSPTSITSIASTSIPIATPRATVAPSTVAPPTSMPQPTVVQASSSDIIISSYGSGYNRWGRPLRMDNPNASCNDKDDSRPVKQFQTRLRIENRSTQVLKSWKVGFIKNDGNLAFFCFYEYIPEIPPGSFGNWTLNAYIEENETISKYYVYSAELDKISNVLTP